MATQVEFSQQGYRQLVRALSEAMEAYAKTEAPAAQPAATVETPGVQVEPWIIFGSHEQARVAAYVDETQNQRWVRVDREHEAPKTWRKLYRATS